MNHDEVRALRGLAYSADGKAVVAFLTGEQWVETLQMAGDALLVALDQHTDGADRLAQRCATLLRERGWTGDEELADQLAAATGDGPAPTLRPVPVDLDELSSSLEGDPVTGGGWLDVQTGEVLPQQLLDSGALDEDDTPDLEDDDRWLRVDSEGSREGYRDMELFIDDLGDTRLAAALSRAIEGKGAFRRFRDRLWEEEEEEQARWEAFSTERRYGRARAWLAQEGYRPAVRKPS